MFPDKNRMHLNLRCLKLPVGAIDGFLLLVQRYQPANRMMNNMIFDHHDWLQQPKKLLDNRPDTVVRAYSCYQQKK